MALFPYFPRLWTTEGVTGLRSFFSLFLCLFALFVCEATGNTAEQLQADGRCLVFVGAVIARKQKDLGTTIPLRKNRPGNSAMQVYVSRVLSSNTFTQLLEVSEVCDADVTPNWTLCGRFRFVCWLVGFWDGTGVHFNISNFAVVWSGCVHMTWCLCGEEKKRKKKNTNDIF